MKLKYISWIPAVAMMLIIYSFSAKPAEVSDESSMAIVQQLVQIYENTSNNLVSADLKQSLDHIVRKSAHFSEYALFAVTIAFHMAVINWKQENGLKRNLMFLFVLPVILAFLYACTDELHQTLVPGRSGLFKDVLIDTSGAAAGAIIFTIVSMAVSRKRHARR